MKRVGKPVFFIVAILIFALTYTAFFGVYYYQGDLKKTVIRGANDIRFGTDINGGVNLTLGPKDDVKATSADMDKAKNIVEVRLVNNNITDSDLYADNAHERIILSFPWKNSESTDVEEMIDELAASAELLFLEGVPSSVAEIIHNEDGTTTVKDVEGKELPVVLTGKDIDSAFSSIQQESSTSASANVVSLELKESGKAKFAEATGRLVNQQISIWLDSKMLSAPSVNQQISDGKAIITGNFTAATAKKLADQINGGALPIPLEVKDYNIISASLGRGALNAMVLAGLIAFIIVCIIMLFRFRLPGFVACIALLGQIAGSIAAVSGYFGFIPSFTLTLPGIAGIIMSIGMGVDANIITAERIREEINMGKTIDGALNSGNDHSLASIIDGNVTVIIVSIILMFIFGPPNKLIAALLGPSTTGAIYSFGYTLLVGVIFNFIMGVWASRAMIRGLSRFKLFRTKWLYGGASK
ncbi:MAG: SecD/SecF family protein translocase subunit [Oscillospiraceae bacterium]|jgi:protein-export membrane protein SecD|nr:SecD/SecF family protein translocase subunit [Oscillospiraceae bacterium]